MARRVQCVLLKREADGLDYVPYPGELGKRIYNSISKEAWAQWVAHQTMLINENRLTPIEPKARAFLVAEMEKFLFGERVGEAEGVRAEVGWRTAVQHGFLKTDVSTRSWRAQLGRELGGWFVLKILALTVLWALFFSGSHRVRVDAPGVADRLALARMSLHQLPIRTSEGDRRD